VPLRIPRGNYSVRAASPAVGVDVSTGFSPPFAIEIPYVFVTSPFGTCFPSAGKPCGSGLQFRTAHCVDVRVNISRSTPPNLRLPLANGSEVCVCVCSCVCVGVGFFVLLCTCAAVTVGPM
jgi:hypothetical protein